MKLQHQQQVVTDLRYLINMFSASSALLLQLLRSVSVSRACLLALWLPSDAFGASAFTS